MNKLGVLIKKIKKKTRMAENNQARIEYSQWLKRGTSTFIPTDNAQTVPRIEPGVYNLRYNDNVGFYLFKKDLNLDELINLESKESIEVLDSIKTFWARKDKFKEYGFIHKRGILLYGVPGCFTKGTLVKTENGHVPIEEVKPWDYVLTVNEKTGEYEYKPVAEQIVYKKDDINNREKRLIKFTLKNKQEIVCTDNHEFLINGRWKHARDIARRAVENNTEYDGTLHDLLPWESGLVTIQERQSNSTVKTSQTDFRTRSFEETSQSKSTCNRIQCNGERNKENCSGISLEASEIKIDDIVNIFISLVDEDTYDLSVLDNHNYVITESDIIVHNSGKSSVINLLANDLITNMDGVVFILQTPNDLRLYRDFVSEVYRLIEPDRPIITVIEDIDGLCDRDDTETTLINILDGIEQIDNVCYVATTNYTERLSERILNRPNRFDRRIHIGFPTPKVRRKYFKFKLKLNDLKSINLKNWVDKTEGMTIAHLGELIKSVIILGNDFDETVKLLESLKEIPQSFDYNKHGQKKQLGFGKFEDETAEDDYDDDDYYGDTDYGINDNKKMK